MTGRFPGFAGHIIRICWRLQQGVKMTLGVGSSLPQCQPWRCRLSLADLCVWVLHTNSKLFLVLPETLCFQFAVRSVRETSVIDNLTLFSFAWNSRRLYNAVIKPA